MIIFFRIIGLESSKEQHLLKIKMFRNINAFTVTSDQFTAFV